MQTQDVATGGWDVSVTFAWDVAAGKPRQLESDVMYAPASFAHLEVRLTVADLKAGTFTWTFTTPAACQTCEVWLFGKQGVRPYHRMWRPFPGPVLPIPNTLWQPPAGSVPASGNYVYLDSDAGDYIGQGQKYLYTQANAAITVSASGGHLSVSVNGDEWWNGDFQTMNTLTTLQPGYYPDLQRYPFHNPTKGGLDWSGEGRGSNTLTGWFAIDSVTYVNGVVTAIDLRFELHSEGATPALHGAIHWTGG